MICGERMRFEPKLPSRDSWINISPLPPRGFVTTVMKLSMVAAAQRHRELIAGLAPHCPTLCEAQVVGIRGPTTANQTGLLGHMSNVLAVANPARLGQRQHTLIDLPGSRPLVRPFG